MLLDHFVRVLLAVCGLAAIADSVVRVGVDQATLPFVDAKHRSGLEVEIIRSALRTQGVDTVFEFLPNARVKVEFEQGRIDVNTSASPADRPVGVLTHWPITYFENQAIFLKSRYLDIKNIRQLGRYRVIAWQEASQYLGNEFQQMAAANPEYRELPTMPTRMLLVDRADVFVSQPDIFRANLLADAKEGDRAALLEKLGYAAIFPEGNAYWYSFKSPATRDKFEAGLAEIYRTGEIDKILRTYAQKFGTGRDFLRKLDCRFLKKSNRPKCD